VDAGVEDRDDVGMGQRRDRLRLALEPRAPIRVVRERRRQHLDRHVAPETPVFRAIDLAHPAGADGGGDFVGTEARAGLETHGDGCSACDVGAAGRKREMVEILLQRRAG